MADETSKEDRARRRRLQLLDVEVTPLTAPEVTGLILERALGADGLVIGNLNLHGVYLFHTDPDFRAYCESSELILVDGAPLAWAGRLPGRFRVGSTDWLDELMPVASGLRIAAIGGTAESAAAAAAHMKSHFPGVSWIGVDGYASQEVTEELRETLRDAHIVLVGMGMPLQERWILRNRALLEAKVVANVGGCFDYYAGVQPLAPRWMGRWGVEWAYRLLRSPRRLAHRYLVEPLKLAVLLISRRYR